MSDNYRYYTAKAAVRRAQLMGSEELRLQLREILTTVARCEAMWALQDRIDKVR